jgi:PAS domain S-box-containing protein
MMITAGAQVNQPPVNLAAQNASPRLRWVIGSLCAIYTLVSLALLPFAHTPGPILPAITTSFATAVLIADLCTSFLLLVQFRLAPSWSMLLLAAAYLYTGLMAFLHVMAFPGAWVAGEPLIGTPQTVGWLFTFWSLGYPLLILMAIIAEVRFKDRSVAPDRVKRAAGIVFAAVIGTVVVLALLATLGQSWLPAEIQGERWSAWAVWANWAAAGLCLFAVCLVWLVTRGRNALFLWLSLALIAFMSFNILGAAAGGRYTLGWNASRVSGFISAGLLLLFFLGEFARLQKSLTDTVRQLRETNKSLEWRVTAMVDQAAAGIAQTDRNGRFVFVNDRYCDILGRSRNELLRLNIRDITLPGDRARNEHLFQRAVNGGDAFAVELRYLRGNGSALWVSNHVSAVRDNAGGIAGIMVVCFDITEHRRLEQTLRDSEQRLRRVVEGAPFPMLVHAEDGNVVHISRAWLEITGYRAEDIATIADWAERAYGERREAIQADIDRLYNLDRPIDEGDYTIRTADGHPRIWAFCSSPIGRDERGRRLVVSMAADLTERKQAEERLRLLMRAC